MGRGKGRDTKTQVEENLPVVPQVAKSTSGPEDALYYLGRSDVETERLLWQAKQRERATFRALDDAGIEAGMSVLDVGCGAGDVALIAARVVGPTGRVVGVDSNAALLETARERATAAGLSEIVTFIAGDFRTATLPGPFDAAVGRYVLMYQGDPAAAVRATAEHVHSGGIILFQEYDFTYAKEPDPAPPLYKKMREWTGKMRQRAGLHSDMGRRLPRVFQDAGLPAPTATIETSLTSGPDWPGYQGIMMAVRSALPQMIKYGITTAEEVDIDTFADRLRDQSEAIGAVLGLAATATAWVRKP